MSEKDLWDKCADCDADIPPKASQNGMGVGGYAVGIIRKRRICGACFAEPRTPPMRALPPPRDPLKS